MALKLFPILGAGLYKALGTAHGETYTGETGLALWG